MKKLNIYILEKLKINKSSQYKFNPDDIEGGSNRLIYSDVDSENAEETEGDEMWTCMDVINDNHDGGFIAFQFDSISDSDNFNKSAYDLNQSLTKILEKIIDGKDLGYEVRTKDGHLEVDCINSGSRGTYYIYALSLEGYKIADDALDEDDDKRNWYWLFDEKNFEPIY